MSSGPTREGCDVLLKGKICDLRGNKQAGKKFLQLCPKTSINHVVCVFRFICSKFLTVSFFFVRLSEVKKKLTHYVKLMPVID